MTTHVRTKSETSLEHIRPVLVRLAPCTCSRLHIVGVDGDDADDVPVEVVPQPHWSMLAGRRQSWLGD